MYIDVNGLSERSLPPPSPRKSGYRKDDYIAECPDLLEPRFPIVVFPPPGNGILEKLIYGYLKFLGRNEAGLYGTETFTEYKSSSREVIYAIYSVKIV